MVTLPPYVYAPADAAAVACPDVLGFGDQGLMFRVQALCLGFRVYVQGSGFVSRVQGSGIRV